jgi:RND family efflux transporter MFP subunit
MLAGPVTRLITRRRAGATAIVAVAVIASGGALQMLKSEAAVPDPAARTIDVQVRAVHTLRRSGSITVSGELEARHTVSTGFQVGGLVAAVGPEEGARVRQGDVLAELDAGDYRLQLELAEAAAARVTDEFERAQQIFAAASMAPADFTKIETAAREARAHEQLARRRLAHTRLLAPLSGVVAHRRIEPGEQVAPGVPVFTIVAMDPMQVRVGVPEAEIGRIRVGQTARVSIPSLGGAAMEGRVRLTGVAADPVSRTYTVRIALPNPDGRLRPGMIAEVSIEDDTQVSALTLPGEAVVRDPDGRQLVYVYFPAEGRVHARVVSVGSVYGTEVEITAGLAGDERVVIGGQHRVRDGSAVRAVELPGPAAAAAVAPGDGVAVPAPPGPGSPSAPREVRP